MYYSLVFLGFCYSESGCLHPVLAYLIRQGLFMQWLSNVCKFLLQLFLMTALGPSPLIFRLAPKTDAN